jgi:hypothetical protein
VAKPTNNNFDPISVHYYSIPDGATAEHGILHTLKT